jgi:hypothetical protein
VNGEACNSELASNDMRSVDAESVAFLVGKSNKNKVSVRPWAWQRSYAKALAFSRWLPTAEARVRSQVRVCGIYGAHSGTVAGFLRVLRFPMLILILVTVPL